MNIDYRFTRDIVVDAVRTTGSTKNLGPTELALINQDKPKVGGYDAIGNTNGLSKNSILKLKWGTIETGHDKLRTNKDFSTIPFKKGDIKSLRVETPQKNKLEGDVFIIGYNGEAGSGITLNKNSGLEIGIKIKGETLELHGIPGGCYEVKSNVFAPRELPSLDNFINKIEYPSTLEARTNHEIVEQAVERLKNKPILHGFTLQDFVDVKLVTSIDDKPTTSGKVVNVQFVVPLGDNSLKEITSLQKQYPQAKIEHSNKVYPNSVVYEAKLVDETVAKAFKEFSYDRDVYVKYDCEDCEENEVKFMYILTGQGVDKTELTDFGAGVTKDAELTKDGQLYILADEEVDFTAFLTKQTSKVEISNAIKIKNKCLESKSVKTTIKPEITETYDVIKQKMTITLMDNECGESRLEELQKYYGSNVEITEADNGLKCSKTYTAVVKGLPVEGTCEGQIRDTFLNVDLKGFEGTDWKVVNEKVYKEDTEVGIRLEGKTITMSSDKPYTDSYPIVVGFTEISPWMTDESNGYRTYENVETNQPQQITWVRRGQKPDGLGYEYLDSIIASQRYFTGETRDAGNGYFNQVYGKDFPLDPLAQYTVYYLEIVKTNRFPHSEGVGDRVNYRFIVPLGQHQSLEDLLNKIADFAGIDQVKA